MWPGVPERPLRRLASKAAAAVAAAFAVAMLAGCGEATRPSPGGAAAPLPPAAAAMAGVAAGTASPAPATLELGRKVYNFRCYFCHGYSGDAKTLATSYLTPKPLDFTAHSPQSIARERMRDAVRDGRPGTAMKGFTGIISNAEIEAVTDFVRHEFMQSRNENTRYHTAENGWPDHERHRLGFPFARGEIAIDTPWESLTEDEQRGKRLFMSACVTCHDHGRVAQPGAVWESRPLSYPRDAYCTSCHKEAPPSAPTGSSHPQRPATHTFSQPDGSMPLHAPEQAGTDRVAGAYLVHDVRPALHDPTALERRGESLFQKNCAFCHAADGTGKGWIGSFLEPHPRDLTSPEQMARMTRERIAQSIAEGLPGTSMPGWKSVLERPDIDALIAYISRAFHPLAGAGGS